MYSEVTQSGDLNTSVHISRSFTFEPIRTDSKSRLVQGASLFLSYVVARSRCTEVYNNKMN